MGVWLTIRHLAHVSNRLFVCCDRFRSYLNKQISRGNFVTIDDDCGIIPEIRALRHSMVSMVRHVRRSQTQSIRYADNLTEGQEAERLRIARELHDDTIQSLVAISQSIDMAKAWVTIMPDRVSEMLQLTREQSVETVNSLRRLIEDLRRLLWKN